MLREPLGFLDGTRNGGGGSSSAATVKAATTDDDVALRVRERARACARTADSSFKAGAAPYLRDEGMSLINAAVRQSGVTGRGSASRALRRARGLRGPLAEAPPRNQREADASTARTRTGGRRPSRRAYGVANVARCAWARSGARARRRGATRSGAARFSRLGHSFSQNFATKVHPGVYTKVVDLTTLYHFYKGSYWF
jgi:hypothetical protein